MPPVFQRNEAASYYVTRTRILFLGKQQNLRTGPETPNTFIRLQEVHHIADRKLLFTPEQLPTWPQAAPLTCPPFSYGTRPPEVLGNPFPYPIPNIPGKVLLGLKENAYSLQQPEESTGLAHSPYTGFTLTGEKLTVPAHGKKWIHTP